MTKVCKKCLVDKPLESFYTNQFCKDGRRSRCIACWKIDNQKTPEQNRAYRAKNIDRIRENERNKQKHKQLAVKVYNKVWRKRTWKQIKDNYLKRQYGISQVQYQLMLMDQSSCCAICNTHQNELKRALAVDHCHKTNKVRGLLCDRCNRSLGLLKDSREILLKAADYVFNV